MTSSPQAPRPRSSGELRRPSCSVPRSEPGVQEIRGRVLVGALPYPHPAVGDVLCLGDVADADADLLRGDALEEVFDGGAVRGREPRSVADQLISSINA